eukprot:TRINITY_DN23168_c0_g1_i2.p1 TRINITY_DN23168_c0_g1~~TRINITY_DN23168_c0_g1_i2.p1  ORF type:complete len:260 (+),score=23.25 TRINITY_DN23168_c0_g1_i2:126-905(+)
MFSASAPDGPSPEAVAKYVARRNHALHSLQVPAVVAAISTLIVSFYDSFQHGHVSPVFGFSLVIGLVSFMLGHSQHIDDVTVGLWSKVMAGFILGYIFVSFFIVGYHEPLHDRGNIRAASTFLAVFVAQNPQEALVYLVVHFVLCLGADVPNLREEMIMLLITDVYLVSASWGKEALRDSLAQLLDLSQLMGKRVKRKVQETLSYLCDAVVVLDDECNLLEPSPALGSLLGRNAPAGRRLHELCHHESLETLEKELLPA